MTLIRRTSPFDELFTLRRAMDRLFDDDLGRARTRVDRRFCFRGTARQDKADHTGTLRSQRAGSCVGVVASFANRFQNALPDIRADTGRPINHARYSGAMDSNELRNVLKRQF